MRTNVEHPLRLAALSQAEILIKIGPLLELGPLRPVYCRPIPARRCRGAVYGQRPVDLGPARPLAIDIRVHSKEETTAP